jgi:hypothetical protein
MLQLIRMAVGLLCGFPLPIRIFLILIFPAIPNFINPINQLVLWLLIFAPIYFGNSWLSKDDTGQRNFGRSFRNSYFIYHAVFVVIYAFAAYTACAVSSQLDQAGF